MWSLKCRSYSTNCKGCEGSGRDLFHNSTSYICPEVPTSILSTGKLRDLPQLNIGITSVRNKVFL
jgi:hypothetical protein